MNELTNEEFNQLVLRVAAQLAVNSQGTSQVEIVNNLSGIISLPATQILNNEEKIVSAPIALLHGKELSLRVTDQAIQSRLGDGIWVDLITISKIQEPATNAALELTQVREDAISATKSALETAENPTYIGEDWYVYKWNKETKSYDKTNILVKGESAFELWRILPENENKTYEDFVDYNRLPATEAAATLGQYQTQVTSELTQLAENTLQAKTATETATSRANEIASNPTKVGDDHYVYVYNETTKSYDKTDIYVKGDKGDKGNLLYASFEIDLESGQLVQTTPDEYTGPTFELNNDGELIAIING